METTKDKMTNKNALAKHHQTCGRACLGPLTFHPKAVGKKITLSHGNLRASRTLEANEDSLVFSSRPVKIREKVQLRVERCIQAWTGALWVGFTSVCPTNVPLAPMPRPDLTKVSCVSVPHEYCLPGTTVSVWIEKTGELYVKTSTGTQSCTKTDLDLTQPLWAVIDVYGQSTTVLLLGSVKRNGLFINKSCKSPVSTFVCGYENTSPELLEKIEMHKKLKECQEDQSNNNNPQETECSQEDLCSVCLVRKARLAPHCGHRCLCLPCANRVFTEFSTCPLCRQSI